MLPVAVALLALAACDKPKQPQIVDTNPDPMASTLANAAPVELPPAIKAEKTMRCKDGSLAYVTFYTGDKQAVVKSSPTGTPTVLKADTAGKPLTAEGGWAMTGDTSAVSLTQPGKGTLSCHA